MTEKPKIPYNSQMAFAIAAGRDADASRIMAEAMGEIVGKACGFAQLFDFSDLPFVVAAQSLARAVEADKSESLPAETVIREMEKGRQGASDRKTVRERLRDVFLSSSYR